MRGAVALSCAVAMAQLAHAADRLEFSGLESPCDEAADTQRLDCVRVDEVNGNITDQIDDLWVRINNELLTYGDTTNECASSFCTVAGGQNNKIDKDASFGFIRGGKANWCYLASPYCAILGGQSNVATGDYCSIGGGIKNKCYSNYGAIGGGYLNAATARFSHVSGGSHNSAQGRYSYAAGHQAIAEQDYSAVFSFTGNIDNCTLSSASGVRVCADAFVINGVDYTADFASSRQLDEVDCKRSESAEEERLSALEQIVSLLATAVGSA